MQKNILVTGANGYIGRNVINYLIENNMNNSNRYILK